MGLDHLASPVSVEKPTYGLLYLLYWPIKKKKSVNHKETTVHRENAQYARWPGALDLTPS